MKKLIQTLIQIFKNFLYPFSWFACSFEGSDGRASGKKLTAAFLTMVAGGYCPKVHDAFTLYAFIALLITILMMWGIITSSNIISLTRSLKGNRKEQND
ncbi:MAG TPA: hypothetical protein VGF79_15710 [Bacteroidia bacterium]